jgi:outer membrane protein insertion porin family
MLLISRAPGRRSILRWVVAALIATAALPLVANVSQSPIAYLAVESDGPVNRDATLEVLGLEIGGTLDRKLLRDAILAMYASTGAEWVRIEAAETPDGLDVMVRISVKPTVAQIHVDVGNRILRKRIEKWLEVGRGDVVSLTSFEAGERRITRKLRERGYADPQVDIFLDYRRETNTVAVTVAVELGLPLTVRAVKLTGIGDPEIAAAATPKVKPGKKLSLRFEEKIRQQVENDLKEAGYWEAEVLRVEHEGEGDEVDLEVVVDPGNFYQLELNYPDEGSKAVLNAIPDPKKEEIHPQQTDALAERVRERLQESGYLLAEVSAQLVTGTTGPVLHITAEPGMVRKVQSITFPGANSLTEKLLLSTVTVRKGAVRGLRGQDVSVRSLERDRLALVDLYRRYGFPEAELATPKLEAEGDDSVRVVFSVDEGLRWFLTDLRLEGLPAETVAALERTTLPIEEATPWDPRQVEETRRRLEGLLADTGYPDGRVEAEVDASRLGDARVVFRTDPGGFVSIGKIVIAGLRRTRKSVVSRTLRRTGVREGEPYSRARMLEAQQQLYELALFRRVELLPMPGQERHSARGVVVLLEEGLHKSYVVGLGWNETDRFRVTLGWYHLNLFGGAHAFAAETVLSSREQRFQVGLREPRLPKLDVPAYLVIYRTFEKFPAYAQRRQGLWIDLGDRYKLPFRSWWRYEYQLVQPEVQPEDPQDPLPPEEQEARISSLTPTLEWDYRDSPLNPSKGTYSEISLSYAFPLFAADSEFLKLQARTTLYGKIANGRGAIGIRLGAMKPLGPDTGKSENLQVPINTRFFAGGANTHRAFPWDGLGIPGETLNLDGDGIGGNALVLINAEYVRKLTGLFSAHIFMDAGNVWASPNDVRFEDIRWGAGLGVSLDTPAGPIRLEYGWKLDREPGESVGQLWLSFGIPF